MPQTHSPENFEMLPDKAISFDGKKDMGSLPKEEARRAFEKYQLQFQELDTSVRVEAMEQFLQYGTVNETEAQDIIPRMTEDERAAIGEYIGKIMNPELYSRVFHDCWESLDYEQRELFEKKFLHEHPEDIFMIAPFIEISQYAFEKDDAKKIKHHPRHNFYPETDQKGRKRNEEKTPERSLTEKFFGDFENAKKLMEECLRFPDKRGLESALDYYKEKNPYFLFPYLPQLLDIGVIDKEYARGVLKIEKKSWGEFNVPFINTDFFMTSEEKNEQKRIYQKVQSLNKDEEENKNFSMPIQNFKVRPASMILEHFEISERAKRRAFLHAFSNLDKQNSWFEKQDRTGLLLGLSQYTSILTSAQELQITPAEIKKVLSYSFENGYQIFSSAGLEEIPALVGMGMENEIVKQFLVSLGDDDDEFLSMRFVSNIKNILPVLTEANQQKMLKAITAHAPEAWVYNLDFVVENHIVPLDELFSRIAKKEWEFFHLYKRLSHEISTREKIGNDNTIGMEKLKRITRDAFKRYPWAALQFEDVFQDVYTKEERHAFLQDTLKYDPSANFISSLLSKVQEKNIEHKDEYCQSIRTLFTEHPTIFSEFLQEGYQSWKDIIFLFPTKTRFELLFSKFSSMDFDDSYLCDDKIFIEDLADNRYYTVQLLSMFEDKGHASALSQIYNEAQRQIKWGSDSVQDINKKKKREERLGSIQGKAIESLKKLCLADPKIMCQDDTTKCIKEMGLHDEFIKILGSEIRTQPELISGYNITGELSNNEYSELVQKNIRPLAFIKNSSGVRLYRRDSLTENAMSALEKENPFLRFENQGDLPSDYYQEVMKEAQKNPFFALYKSRMEKIAAQENEKNGPRTDSIEFTPNREFDSLASRIAVFNSSKDIIVASRHILNLEQEDRDEIIKILEFIALNRLDADSEQFKKALNALEDNPPLARERLSEMALKHIIKVFQLDMPEARDYKKLNLDTDTFQALITYYNNVCRTNAHMRDIFHEYVTALIQGNYEPWRQKNLDESQNEGFMPKKLTEEQYEKWNGADTVEFNETLEFQEQDIRQIVRTIFSQAVADQHIKDEELPTNASTIQTKYDALSDPLKEWTSQMQEVKKRIQDAKKSKKRTELDDEKLYKELQMKITEYKDEYSNEFSMAEANLYLSHLRTITMDEFSSKKITIGKTSVPFSKVFRALEQAYAQDHPEFYQDIRRIQTSFYEVHEKIFGKETVSRSKLSITDGIDASVYLQIGEIPVASCQSYRSRNYYNRGLLSYIADANVKIIQMYDSDNRLVARAAMRILENEDGSPQLFMERVYSVNSHQKISEAMAQFAKNKARKLNIGLFSHSLEGMEEEQDVLAADLHSRGSRSPYVYTDAGGGLKKNGIYTIRHAYKIT